VSFWTISRVGAAIDGMLDGARPEGEAPLGAISTDSRTTAEGDVFLALGGERFNGHDFVAAAVARRAAALIISEPRAGAGAGIPLFVVADTTRALGSLGMHRRRAWGGPVVAVAGSNGKTSTKAMIAAALGSRLTVHVTPGNQNNHVGVPHALLAIPDHADVSVIEIGTNHPGEVGQLRAIVEPDIAVVTSIGEEHLEGLGDLEGVLREETAVLDGASLAVCPADCPGVAAAAARRGVPVVDAGLATSAVHPSGWGLDESGTGWFVLDGTRFAVPLIGVHNIRNALLAVAVARACGVSDEDAARGLAALPPIAMRSQLEPAGGLLLFNDAYNANPSSAREALLTLDAIGGDRPRVAVLASMLELGVHASRLHDEIARLALASRAGTIVAIGLFRDAFARVAPHDARVVSGEDAEEVWPRLRERLSGDSVVLLKGSRGTRLERLVPHLREFAGLAPTAVPIAH
jgi:UDP-N-acetylmuramoyl-tripeptide--D-alanyl-D-alanine ligase